jgi:hypothetical protein
MCKRADCRRATLSFEILREMKTSGPWLFLMAPCEHRRQASLCRKGGKGELAAFHSQVATRIELRERGPSRFLMTPKRHRASATYGAGAYLDAAHLVAFDKSPQDRTRLAITRASPLGGHQFHISQAISLRLGRVPSWHALGLRSLVASQSCRPHTGRAYARSDYPSGRPETVLRASGSGRLASPAIGTGSRFPSLSVLRKVRPKR